MSLAVEPQPSASGLPPVVYTTVVPFTNYSQWERRSKAPEAIKKAVSGKTRTKSKALATSGKSTTHCHRHTTANEQPVIINSRPQYDGKKLGSSPKPRTTSGSHPSRSESATRLRLLRMAVATTKVSVEDLKHHKEKLFSTNLSLVYNIQSSEDHVHTDVDKMLEKYTSFKGTLSKLQTKASEQLEKAKKDLERTTANLEEDISELHTKVINTERLVRKKSRELSVLLNYKDKEFPMKCMKIEQLREQCELIGEENEAEVEEVEQQIAEEWDRHRQAMEDVKRDLTTRAAQASLATMKKSVYEKAVQNRIMKKELVLHESKHNELEDSITLLKVTIKKLSEELERKTHSRHKSPLSALGKCSPNTELKFDFPKQQQLPF